MTKNTLDPLEEKKYTKIKGLIHKYETRVLVLLSSRCPQTCPFCFRKRIINSPKENLITKNQIQKMVEYVQTKPLVNEVIFSGGEPLMEPRLLLFGLKQFSTLKQIKILRIHSRAPVVKPDLVNQDLLAFITTSQKPVYFSIHINHPRELTPKTQQTINKLRHSGAILLSQTVFLRNINDNFTDLKQLFSKLAEIGVRPYYLHHCDPVLGNEKYAVPIKKEIKIVSRLREELSGLACPILVKDSPEGKRPLC